LELIAGTEWRDERVRYDMAPPTDVSGSQQRSIVAAFGELRVPLINEAAHVPALHDLDLVFPGVSTTTPTSVRASIPNMH
jgi:hypothetical protein